VNATTGSKIWQYATNGGVESSPAVVDGVVYIGCYNGFVYALNAASGAQIWSFNTGGSVYPSPAVADGMVYVGSATGRMYALNTINGSPSWSYYTGGKILSSPAVVDGVVYFGSEDQNVYALRASDGSQIWHHTTGGYIDAAPVVADGIVYVGSRDGYIYALNAANGVQIWSFYPPHRYYSGGPYYYSTPAVADGIVYVGSYDSYVYALNSATGGLLWESPTGNYIFSSPVVAGGAVYVGSYDGNIYALDAGTGDKIWSYQTGNKTRSSAAVANGVVYVGSGNGYLYAFGSNTAKNITVGGTPPTSITVGGTSPTSNKTKISGYVLDPNGKGLARAEIIFGVPKIVPSVYTDHSGYYTIYAPAGTYHLNVWPPFDSNYLSYDQPAFSVGSSDIIKNITLSSGYKLSGYLTDSTGAPIRGALASLNLFHCGWYSNSTGYYFVTAPAGTYKLMIQPKKGPTFSTYTENNFVLTCDTVRNFTLTTSGNTPVPTSNPEPTSTLLSITVEATTLQEGSTVNVIGKLSDQNGNPLVDKTVILSYALNSSSSWFQIGSGKTNANGEYSIQWVVGASSTFTLKAEWAGDTSYSGACNSTTLSFLPYQNQQVFYVESNSTVTALAFNSTTSELSFTVSGPSETTGYVKVTIAKSLVSNPENIKVYLDGNQLNYEVTSAADSWLLSFTYTHSTHQVSINLAINNSGTTLPSIEYWTGIVVAIIVVVIGISLLVYLKKRKQ